MKIQPFLGKIDKIQYKTFKSNSNEGQELYACLCNIIEIGKGLAKYKRFHNALLYLSIQQYNEKYLEKGDIINFKENCQWKSYPFTFRSYNPNIIKNKDKSLLKIDNNGKTYYEESAYAYKIVCKEGSWDLKEKYYEKIYCTITRSGLKLPLETKNDFFNQDNLKYFLDIQEMQKISKYDGMVETICAYNGSKKLGEKKMTIKLTQDKDAQTNILSLVEVNE